MKDLGGQEASLKSSKCFYMGQQVESYRFQKPMPEAYANLFQNMENCQNTMKVLIQYTEAGKYRDQAWEALTVKVKGDVAAVTPSYAAQLIKEKKACLMTSDDEQVIFYS